MWLNMLEKKLTNEDIRKLLDWVNKLGIDYVERSLLKECNKLFLCQWDEPTLDRYDKLSRCLRYVRDYLKKKYAK